MIEATVAVKTNGGVYLSWRLLGTESLTNQAFDIYRDSEKIYTTGEHDATCYTDSKGTADNKYTVVPKGEAIDKTEAVDVWTTNTTYKGRSVAYKDIAFKVPDGGKTPKDEEYTYTANDMSVGDLDGDGEYEYIVKWDPSNSKDNSVKGYTGNVYLDAYELDGTLLWRIDLGVNIRAGAHYTQYMVYDFDGDGKSEVILKTAPGSKDGEGNYVSKAGTKGDDKKDYRNSSGLLMGKDGGPEYLTVFNGETGAAMQTVDFDPPRSILTSSKWGDSYANRSERYLAAVAYLDGVHPSVVMTRGYYTYVYAAAYTWDGTDLKEQWLSTNTPTEANGGTGCTVKYADGTSKNNTNKTLYAQGAHSVSVADVDNDGYDEIIFGSAVLDHDGTVLTYDGRGHGDAEHVSDFDNDGKQEIFMAHEAGKHNDKIIPYAVDIKRYNGDIMLQAAQGDIGRGIMDNVDDEYALSSGNLSLFWSVAADGIYNQAGEKVGDIPNSHGSNMENFAVYWDGDLGRELLDGNKLVKYSVTSGTERIYCNSKNATLPGSINNSSKSNACLTADLFGDWREEVMYPLKDGSALRIYTTTTPTSYKIPTLMHDIQYRMHVAYQNDCYNQPTHLSYYLGFDTENVPVPQIYTVGNNEKNPDLAKKSWNINDLYSGEKVELVLDTPTALTNGVPKRVDNDSTDVVPYLDENERTLVPLRFISESFGADVEWVADTQEIKINGDAVTMKIGSNDYTVNNETKTMDTAPILNNDRTMVPLRAIGEALGKIVYYNDKYICISDIDLNMSDDSAISRKSTITSAKVPDKIEVVAINGTGQKYYPNQLDVFAVEASDNDGNVETGAVDLDINTRWSSYGKSTLTLDLGEEKDVSGVAIAMWKGSERIYPFTIEYSVDGKTWETALPKTQNTGESSEFEKYMFPETVKARYIRYNGDGATDPDKNYCHISEIAVLGAEE